MRNLAVARPAHATPRAGKQLPDMTESHWWAHAAHLLQGHIVFIVLPLEPGREAGDPHGYDALQVCGDSATRPASSARAEDDLGAPKMPQ
jgi:hypothetical protein